MGRSVDENSVIKIVAYECGEFVGLAKEIEKQIKALPSVQPEPLTDKEQNELISRQAAIDAINNAFDSETLLTGFVRSVAIRAIREMPSAHRLHITGYIPEAWIENEIKWLRGVGNHFAALTAMNIEAMLKRWREQQESEEDKDGRGR